MSSFTMRTLRRSARRPGSGLPVAPMAPHEPTPETTGPSQPSLVDSAVYVDGVRVFSPRTLATTYQALNDHDGALAWIGLYRPREGELQSLAREFGLHELAVEDAVQAHQRPKIERYDETLFVVLRPARYVDDQEEVEFGEVHVFVGHDFVLTVRHSEAPDLARVRHRLEADPDLLRLGPEAVLYAVLDEVVDGYAPVVAGLENDIDEIEEQVFRGDPAASRRIYELSREVMEFQRATRPLSAVLRSLVAGFQKYETDEDLQRYLRDVEDHLTQVVEQVAGFRALLKDILTVNATLVAQQQNDEMKSLTEASMLQGEEVKKISAWAAILFAPTLIGTVYGMNFTHMPELDWRAGYPAAVASMVLLSVGLYAVFRRRGWI